ncbi:WD repeat-containing protein 74 [Bombus flavifrons]|uniref:WD repeat-containing protein 74 n=1 Tax=Bombus flavifrons TaxID=103934 RepID=UPI003704257B
MSRKDNYDIYVGGKSGIFKGVRIDKKQCVSQNIQNLISITDNDEVTTMSWGDDEEREILIACGVKDIRSIKVYDTDCSTFTCSFFCNIGTGKITGISRYNEAILSAVQSGEIKLWRFQEEDGFLMNAGKNLDKMRHSRINKHIIATGGQEHALKLFDIEKQTQIFIEKNVPPDWLQLRVPIWISDIDFLHGTEEIVTTSKYGYVRLYDPKSQRRPVINVEVKNEALTTLTVVPQKRQIIVGSGKGIMNLIDLRKPAKVLNTYKGSVGAVTGIACSRIEPHIISVGLDRFLQIHHMNTKELLRKVYLTSKISCMLLRSEFSLAMNKEVNEENTQQCKNKTTKNFQGKQQTMRSNSDSDSEYDMLFEKMPVISNKEDRSIERKQRKTNPSRLDNKIISRKYELRKDELSKRQYKKIKRSNSIIEL